jgi:hypothetical protein
VVGAGRRWPVSSRWSRWCGPGSRRARRARGGQGSRGAGRRGHARGCGAQHAAVVVAVAGVLAVAADLKLGQRTLIDRLCRCKERCIRPARDRTDTTVRRHGSDGGHELLHPCRHQHLRGEW